MPDAAPAGGRGAGTAGSGSGATGPADGTGAIARGGGGVGTGTGTEDRGRLCTVAIDVRGLPKFERGQSSFVFDGSGNQIWPDAQLIKDVSSRLVNDGNLQSYVTNEAELEALNLPNLIRVKASKVQPNKFAPQSSYNTDAVLDDAAAASFRAAGTACRVVYLKDQ